MLWNITPQQDRKALTLCKRIRLYPSQNKAGELVWYKLRIRLWQVLIEGRMTGKATLALKVKMTLDEKDNPKFDIIHPEKQVYQTITRGGREIPIHDATAPMLTVAGEKETFYTTKELRQRIAKFAGMSFANEVISVFLELTPLGLKPI